MAPGRSSSASRPRRTPGAARGLLPALAVSLLLHAALLLLPDPPPRAGAEREAIELAIRWVEPPSDEPASDEPPDAPAPDRAAPSTRPDPARPPRAQAKAPRAAAGAATPGPARPAASGSVGDKGDAAGRDEEAPAPDAATAGPDRRFRRRAPDLELRLRLGEERAPDAPAERLERLFAEDRARRRATDGKHPYWSELGRAMERDFVVDPDLLRRIERRGLAPGVVEGLESWMSQAEAYGSTGNPYGEGPMVPGSPTLADLGRPQIDRTPQPYEGVSEQSIFESRLVVQVLLVQDADGAVREARLHRTSGNPAYDRLALQQARALARLRLEPPPNGTSTLWAFEATLRTTPPLPVAGCAVDAYFVPTHCFYPLSERLSHRVRLLAVYREGQAPAADGR